MKIDAMKKETPEKQVINVSSRSVTFDDNGSFGFGRRVVNSWHIYFSYFSILAVVINYRRFQLRIRYVSGQVIP